MCAEFGHNCPESIQIRPVGRISADSARLRQNWDEFDRIWLVWGKSRPAFLGCVGGVNSGLCEGGRTQVWCRSLPHRARTCTRIGATGALRCAGAGFHGPERIRPTGLAGGPEQRAMRRAPSGGRTPCIHTQLQTRPGGSSSPCTSTCRRPWKRFGGRLLTVASRWGGSPGSGPKSTTRGVCVFCFRRDGSSGLGLGPGQLCPRSESTERVLIIVRVSLLSVHASASMSIHVLSVVYTPNTLPHLT